MKITAEKEMWFITEGETKHKGKLEIGQWIESVVGIKTFDTEDEWKTEVEKLGLDKDEFSPKLS